MYLADITSVKRIGYWILDTALHNKQKNTAAKLFMLYCSPDIQYGAPARTRTVDPVIKSHLLYRLSYERTLLSYDFT